MVLCGGERQYVAAIAQGKEADFLANQAVLDDDFGSGGAERTGKALVDCRLGARQGVGDSHPLAGGKAVCLDDDRRATAAGVGLGGGGIGEAAVGGGWYAGGGAQVLGEALRGFECRCRAGRAERLDAGGSEVIDEAGDQRRLRSDDDEVDCQRPAGSDDRCVVGDIDRQQFGDTGDARIAGRAVEPPQQRARR